MNEIIIEVKKISKVYDEMTDNPVISLNNISMSIEKGEFICVMGTLDQEKQLLSIAFQQWILLVRDKLYYMENQH